ncbi:MAG: PLP-dependent transferase [Acidimicrobiia bacterium]|nr:PLP-dependent transferase [Acidimicrobiia bacterium]
MPGRSTTSIHADRSLAESPDVAPPIRPSTTFQEDTGRRYRRSSHETTERLEAVIGALEGGSAVAYSSGMAAASAIVSRYRPDRIVLPEVYHGVRDLMERERGAGRLEITDPSGLGEGDIWWVETPSNPTCQITDLEDVAANAHAVGAIVVCDATFATPAGMNPLAFGADVVMHSATKAIAGHSDALAGLVVVSDTEEAEGLRDERVVHGSVPGSLDAWLALRGVRTLPLRQERAAASAQLIAAFVDERAIRTWYPGLASHPGHDVAKRQMRSMGSLMSIDLGDADTADGFLTALGVFTVATSLGGVESLAEHRVRSDPETDPGLVRMSIGIEDVEDLVADLDQALRAVGR